MKIIYQHNNNTENSVKRMICKSCLWCRLWKKISVHISYWFHRQGKFKITFGESCSPSNWLGKHANNPVERDFFFNYAYLKYKLSKVNIQRKFVILRKTLIVALKWWYIW